MGAALHGGDIGKGIALGALSGAAFGAIGGMDWQQITKVVAHGLTGGAMQELQGGKFAQGFAAAGFAQAFAPVIDGLKHSYQRLTAAAVAGGVGSELAGGKFENGAVTGAFSQMLGNLKSNKTKSLNLKDLAKIMINDIKGAALGLVSEPYTIMKDLGRLLSVVPTLNFRQIGMRSLELVQQVLIPNYGYYGGPRWGANGEPWDSAGGPEPLNRVDYASRRHDLVMGFDSGFEHNLQTMGDAHKQWVIEAWSYGSNNPNILPPGPFGNIYRAIGAPSFYIFSKLDGRPTTP